MDLLTELRTIAVSLTFEICTPLWREHTTRGTNNFVIAGFFLRFRVFTAHRQHVNSVSPASRRRNGTPVPSQKHSKHFQDGLPSLIPRADRIIGKLSTASVPFHKNASSPAQQRCRDAIHSCRQAAWITNCSHQSNV